MLQLNLMWFVKIFNLQFFFQAKQKLLKIFSFTFKVFKVDQNIDKQRKSEKVQEDTLGIC